jgi:hypothetical protein
VGRGQARHYRREVAPFSGIADASPAAYADLAVDLPPQAEARLFRPAADPPPPGWETVSARPIVQMIYDVRRLPPPITPDAKIVLLGRTDVAEMLALVDAAKPGPFGWGTINLGTYVGVRHPRTGQLIAMGASASVSMGMSN